VPLTDWTIFDTSDVGEFGFDGFPEFPLTIAGDGGFAARSDGNCAVDRGIWTAGLDDLVAFPFIFKGYWIFKL
jgi:hypothetical protein